MPALLDSCILIDYMRDRPAAVSFVKALKTTSVASVVSITELIFGARSRREERQILALQRWIKFHAVDAAISERAGQHLKHFSRSHGTDDLDALIAATAEQHGLDLATINVKQFPMFKDLAAAY